MLVEEEASVISSEPYTVAIVPAKMSSVRLPQKNMMDFGGNPLFTFSVRAAQLSNGIDEVYVSSEDDNLLSVASQSGSKTIKRPSSLSASDITNHQVLLHALDQISRQNKRRPDLLVLLQPTHPLRSPSDIEQALIEMKEDLQADSLFTVVKTDELRGTIEEDRFKPEFPLPRNKREEPSLYRNTGSFYILRVNKTLEQGSFFGQNIRPYVLKRPEFEIDIDEASDMAQARTMLESHADEFSALRIE